MGCFLLIPYFFIDINKNCHLSSVTSLHYSAYSIYHNAHYGLFFFEISFNVFKYKSYSRHLFYSFHGFEFLDESFKS